MAIRSRSILKKDGVSSSRSLTDKQVGWGSLVIYEFPNVLGDNPGVTSGPPVMIGWEHNRYNIVGIETHELYRLKNPRRPRKDLVVSGGERSTFLLGLGYSLEQVLNATEEADNIRKSRRSNMRGRLDSFKLVLIKFQNLPRQLVASAKAG
ncbi:hypothetical protein ACA910_012074 [Epithemia clementina (nom. ined.)]